MKDYVEALFQQQWGRNLSKYDGIQMLGGVTLNGRQILEDASQFKKDLEEEIRSKYEIPPMDLVVLIWHLKTHQHKITFLVIIQTY